MLRVETYSRVIAEVADGGGWWLVLRIARWVLAILASLVQLLIRCRAY